MGDVEELEVQEIDLDDEDFSCEVTSDDEGTAAVEQEVGIIHLHFPLLHFPLLHFPLLHFPLLHFPLLHFPFLHFPLLQASVLTRILF